MDLNSLRSHLQHIFPNDLTNLTTAELHECKWQTKKRIFTAIISEAVVLREEYNEILDLIEQHGNKLNEINSKIRSGDGSRSAFNTSISTSSSVRREGGIARKGDQFRGQDYDSISTYAVSSRGIRSTDDDPGRARRDNRSEPSLTSSQREVRAEYETTFRTNFLRKVLDCLTKLKWPPSLEAFSDPLSDLFHDAATCHNAMEYLLRVALAEVKERRDQSLAENSSIDLIKESLRNTSDGMESAASSQIGHASMVPNSAVKPTTSERKYRNRSLLKAYTSPDIQNSRLSDERHASVSVPSPQEDSISVSSRSTAIKSQHTSSRWTDCRDEQLPRKLSKLQSSYEKLQRENSLLSESYNALKKHVIAREQADHRIESIFLECQEILQDSHRHAQTSKTEVNADPFIITQQEHDLFRHEVEVEQNETTRLRRQGLPTGGDRVPSHATNISKTKSASRILSTRRDSHVMKDLLERDRAESESGLNNGYKSQANRKQDESDNGNKSNIIFKRLKSAIKEWIDAKNSAQRLAASSLGLKDDIDFGSNLSLQQVPSAIDIQTKKLLGVSISKNQDSIYQDVTLKLDLFSFTIDAFHVLQAQSFGKYPSNGENQGSGNNGNEVALLLNNEKQIREWEQLDIIMQRSQDLLLRLTAYGPLASSIESDERSDRKYSTGLEELVEEISPMISKIASKHSQQKIQKALDRALSEQRNMTRCLLATRSCLKKWPKASLYTVEWLNIQQQRRLSTFKKIKKVLDIVQQSANSLCAAYDNAASQRLLLSEIPIIARNNNGKSSGSSSLSPLDSLCKGGMGDKISLLMNSLKVYLDDVGNMKQVIEELKLKLNEDVKVEDKILEDIIKKVSQANDASANIINDG